MSARGLEARQEARRWSLIARVREVRVKRQQIALAHARRSVHMAHVEVQACEERLALHAARYAPLIARCTHGATDASIWREALVRHRQADAALHASLDAAQTALHGALGALEQFAATLRREMRARDDALSRVRTMNAQLRDEA
ncbi:hypothetical protein [Paraburkholderia bannensis]|uniref:hypothetical protein n=1 Tax=Paraburkholderia bannensis TaxID=765414 RepID=UPI002AB7F310|nr:hypothetical protein [Paraburkholderia bannensis]